MEEEFDQSCKKCLLPMLDVDKPRFYTCGCIVCLQCIDLDASCPEHCPEHNSQVSEQATQDPAIKRLLKEATQLGRQYERTPGLSRDAYDAKVKEIQRSVKALASGSSNPQVGSQPPAYEISRPQYSQDVPTQYTNSELPTITDICPKCHIKIQGMQCICGHVNLDYVTYSLPVVNTASQPVEVYYWCCLYPDCNYQNSAWNNGYCAKCQRSSQEPQPVQVVQTTPNEPSIGIGPQSVWKCTSCSYEYNMNDTSTCLRCSARKPRSTPATKLPVKSEVPSDSPQKPSKQVAQPIVKEPSIGIGPQSVWKCTSCSYEYNMIDTSTCLHCPARKPGLIPEKKLPVEPALHPDPQRTDWLCKCKSWRKGTHNQCAICNMMNPNIESASGVVLTPPKKIPERKTGGSLPTVSLCPKCRQRVIGQHECRGRK